MLLFRASRPLGFLQIIPSLREGLSLSHDVCIDCRCRMHSVRVILLIFVGVAVVVGCPLLRVQNVSSCCVVSGEDGRGVGLKEAWTHHSEGWTMLPCEAILRYHDSTGGFWWRCAIEVMKSWSWRKKWYNQF